MKTLLKIWAFTSGVTILLLILFIASLSIKQVRKTKEFTGEHLIPLANFIEGFQSSNGRLPTDTELKNWTQTHEEYAVSYFTNKPPFMDKWGVAGKDFVVGVWRGERFWYYSSWDKKSFSE
jgi:hypothetical protein